MAQRAIQEFLLPYGHICFGCGSRNPHGMRIRSTWNAAGDAVVCDWTPQAHHCGGPDFVNGGVIATLIDCHTVCTGTAWLYKLEDRPLDSEPVIHCVTASLHVDYLRPTPLANPLHLRAWMAANDGRRITVECALTSGGKETAHGTGVFVRVATSTAAERQKLRSDSPA
jgi:acyl-coenzyme A thioesterase PaaI-like protein